MKTLLLTRLIRKVVPEVLVSDDCRRKGFRDVADAETDDLSGGVLLLEALHPVCDFGEEVAGLYLEVVFVNANHDVFPLK